MRRLVEVLAAYKLRNKCSLDCLSLGDEGFVAERHGHPAICDTFIGTKGSKVKFALKALKLARKHRLSLVVIGHVGLAPIGWGLKRLGLIRSYVIIVYGVEVWRTLPWYDRCAVRNAKYIVSITEFTGREFCRHNGFPFAHIKVIPPVLVEDDISQPLRKALGGGILRVLTVGRLSISDRDKGFDVLIRAVREARDGIANIQLLIVGDGEDVDRLRRLVSSHDLDAEVTFLGAIGDERLRQLYEECDLFVMPSKKEGFGIVFIEAMRYGKPCIGGKHGGTPEVITDGVDGYLVDYGDVKQLARYLVELSKRSDLRLSMGMKGYEKVKSRFLFPHMRDHWFALLDKLSGGL